MALSFGVIFGDLLDEKLCIEIVMVLIPGHLLGNICDVQEILSALLDSSLDCDIHGIWWLLRSCMNCRRGSLPCASSSPKSCSLNAGCCSSCTSSFSLPDISSPSASMSSCSAAPGSRRGRPPAPGAGGRAPDSQLRSLRLLPRPLQSRPLLFGVA